MKKYYIALIFFIIFSIHPLLSLNAFSAGRGAQINSSIIVSPSSLSTEINLGEATFGADLRTLQVQQGGTGRSTLQEGQLLLGNGRNGILATTTNPLYVGSILATSTTPSHFGTSCGGGGNIGGQGLEVCGDDNTTSGVAMGITNKNAGTSAYNCFYLNNDIASGFLHFGALCQNSSTYNDATFGAILNIPNQISLQTTDANLTFIASSATGFINFCVNGVTAACERMRITAAGNVGIGTTTPNSTLSVFNSNTGTTLTGAQAEFANSASGGAGRINIRNNSGDTGFVMTGGSNYSDSTLQRGTMLSSASGQSLFLGSNGGTARVGISSGGLFGVGTTSPLVSAHFSGTSFPKFLFDGAGTTAQSFLTINPSTGTNGNVGIYWSTATASNPDTGQLTFEPQVYANRSSNVGASPVFAINGALSSVGIGTTTPRSGSRLTLLSSNANTTLTTFGLPAMNITNSNTTNNNFSSLSLDMLNTTGGYIGGARLSAVHTDHTAASEDSDLAILTIAAGTMSEKMRIKNTGEVGIGSTTPSFKLVVTDATGNTSPLFIDASSNTNYAAIFHNNGGSALGLKIKSGTTATQGIPFIVRDATETNTWFTIRGGGSVGIGTSTPLSRLDIWSNSATIPDFSTSNLSANKGIIISSHTNVNIIQTWTPTTGGIGTGLSAALAINPSGPNIGLGTTTPSQMVDINGAAAIWGGLVLSGNPSGPVGLNLGTSAATRYIGAGASFTNFLFNVPTGGRFDFDIAESVKMRLDSSGNLGVATTTFNERLSVQGNGEFMGTLKSTVKITTAQLQATSTVFLNGLTSSTAGNAVCILGSFEVVNAGNTTCTTSSLKTKHDIKSLSSKEALKDILKLNPVSFTYNDGGERRVGFIAEEVDEIDPRLVEYAKQDVTYPNSSGTIKKGDPVSVQYGNITALLVKTVQYQQKEIDDLKELIKNQNPQELSFWEKIKNLFK